MFRVGKLRKKSVGAAGFNSGFTKITDRNVSRFVNGHSDYVTNVRLES